MKKKVYRAITVLLAGALGTAGCSSKPVEGPDKVFANESLGALEGAGAGAVTGLHVGAGTGPGALVGAGLGAAIGAVQGFAQDGIEETDLKTQRQIKIERERAVAQEALAEHYKRRLELHPTRDIFPADMFFQGDSVKMCPSGVKVLREIARMNEYRLPYSRLVVAAYAKAADSKSEYAKHLTERRSREFVNQLVRAGVEARRLETRAVVVNAPILIDPMDNPTRYNQAIEIIPVDR
jgi:outer membrane protein OmpA-like peptidoglycan-associated protein